MSAGDADAAVRVFSLCSKQACRLDFLVLFFQEKSTEEINMNGRLYDPVIARFFSPDKYVASA